MLSTRSPATVAHRAPALPRPWARPCILVRAEPPSGPKVTREYREESDEVVVPGASGAPKRADGAMYVDANDQMRAQRPKSNLSKEMKARLREEYTGWGGSSDKPAVSFPSPRAPMIVAVAAVETITEAAAAPAAAAAPTPTPASTFEERPAGATQDLHASTSAAAATPAPAAAPAAAAAPKAGASKWVIDENENLKSTPEMRAWTFGSIAMIAATMGTAVQQCSGTGDALVMGVAVMAAYVMADFGTGVYHWGVDNYGDGNTPVFGRQIAAFQGHHQRPWTITQREFCNNMHQVFGPASYPAAALLTLSHFMPVGWNAWSSSFLFLVCMSQQFHAWSHMKKSELPAPVVALQDAGLLISRRMHGAHHRTPFDANYCIVSGICNPWLDKSGFFRNLEKAIHTNLGVEPRCWYEPEHDWRELERPETA